jgi:hypothetical protein
VPCTCASAAGRTVSLCPACGGRRHDPLRSRSHTYECRDCRRQTSITAGTVMHRTKLRLGLWFSAAYLIANHPDSASPQRFAELFGIPYSTGGCSGRSSSYR